MNVSNEKAAFYLEKYAKMISLFAKKVCDKCPDAEYEEIHQILSIKLISIIPIFKHGTCKESSYFYKILERESKNMVRSYYSLKNNPFINQVEFKNTIPGLYFDNQNYIENMQLDDFSNDVLNPENYIKEKELMDLIDDFISHLKKEDKEIFLLNINGMQVKDISKKLNIEKRIIYVKLEKMKKNLAELIKSID